MFGLIAIGAGAWGAPPNPYAILDSYVKAIGGWDALNAQHSSHSKGSLVIVGAGLDGTVETWSEMPNKSRQEVDLKVIKQISGDNGKFPWSVDQNGKLRIIRDTAVLKERELGALMAAHEDLKRGAKQFTVTFDRLDTADGKTCYVLKTTNTLNSFVFYNFYDTSTYRPIKAITIKPDGEVQSVNRDFRMVDGVLFPFQIEQLELPTQQKTTITISELEINPRIDQSLFEPPAEQKRDYRFPADKTMVEVPFKFIEQHVYVPLTIGGQTKLWILDSGAEMTVVDEGFAKEVGLKLEGKITGQGATTTVDVAFATLPPFELGGLAFDSQKVAAIDINSMFRRLLGFDVGGILGYDFLSRLVTKVDYAAEKLTFYEPDSFAYKGSGQVLDAPLTKDRMLRLPITVDDKYSGSWDLDLGATGEELMYLYAEAQGLLNRPGVARMSFGAGGGAVNTMAQFRTLSVAGFTIPKPIIGIPSAKGTGAFSQAELAGNAGNDLFRHFTIYLDYKREKVILEKGADFEKVFPTDHSGLQVRYDDSNRVVVLMAAPGTPSATAGLQKGDQLASVDGKTIESLGGLVAFRELLKGPIGTVVTLGIVRDGKPLTVPVTLKDLYE